MSGAPSKDRCGAAHERLQSLISQIGETPRDWAFLSPLRAADDGSVEYAALLRGTAINDNPRDTREAFEEEVEKGLEKGLPETLAREEALERRLEVCGAGPEHGFYGEPVQPWFLDNIAVRVKPLDPVYETLFRNYFGMTISEALFRLYYNYHAMMFGGAKVPVSIAEDAAVATITKFGFAYDAKDRLICPGLQPLTHSVEEEAKRIASLLLACRGRLREGCNPGDEPGWEDIHPEVVARMLPTGFYDLTSESYTGWAELLDACEIPYRPIDTGILRSLLDGTSQASGGGYEKSGKPTTR